MATQTQASDWVDDLLLKTSSAPKPADPWAVKSESPSSTENPWAVRSEAPNADWVDDLLNKPKEPAKETSFWDKSKQAIFGPSTALASIPPASEEAIQRASSSREISGTKIGPEGLLVPTTRTRRPNLFAPAAGSTAGLEKPLVDVGQFVDPTNPRTKAVFEVASSLTSPEMVAMLLGGIPGGPIGRATSGAVSRVFLIGSKKV
jgi:hypothetical protein